MEFISDMQKKVQEFASENASTLLTAGGVVGTVATAVLAARGGIKADRILREKETEKREALAIDGVVRDDVPEPLLSKTEKVVLAGPQFIPAIASGGLTVTAIIFANRMSAQKAAALAAAYGLSQKQFEEYKAKVSEKLTGPKRDQVNSELAQERVHRTPGADKIVIIEGGDVLCFDEPTGRYFKSTVEKINRAVNKTNEEIHNGEYATANYFYGELGLKPTTWGEEVGWNRDNPVDIDINVVFADEDQTQPCVAINFKKMPDSYYLRRMYE